MPRARAIRGVGARERFEASPARAGARAGRSWRVALALLLIWWLAAPAWCAVTISFYSRELGGNNFPHAFVVLDGTLDATGERVRGSYGFTAKTITPAILLGSVAGEVIEQSPGYIAHSDRQFALTIGDAQYRAVMGVVEQWRGLPQPSYNLNRRNCVHFVAAIAAAVGLTVDYPRRLMKRPRSYLEHVRSLNPRLLAEN